MISKLEKWKSIGLLEGLDAADQEYAAIYFDNLAFTIARSKELDLSNIRNVLFPIARRLIERRRYPSPLWLIKDVGEWWSNNTKNLASTNIRFDMEQELCVRYVNEYEKRNVM